MKTLSGQKFLHRYRPVRPRLLAKIGRAYRRFEAPNPELRRSVLRENAVALPLEDSSIDAIISSPPYFGALDYGRDNRLRLWFLGVEDYRKLEEKLTAKENIYVPQMRKAVGEMLRLLKAGKYAVLVLGDYRRNGRSRDSATVIEQIVRETYSSQASAERLLVDDVPDVRRSRRLTRTTLHETILVIKKAV